MVAYNIQFGAGITLGQGITAGPAGVSVDNTSILDSLANNSTYTGGYPDIPGKTRPTTTRSFTVEAWVRWSNGVPTVGTILGSLSDPIRQPHFFCLYIADANTVVTDGYFVGQNQFTYGLGFNNDTWYHIAVSRNAANDDEAVWVDGVRIDLQTDSRVYSSNSLTVGNGWPNPQDGKKFQGYQADLRVVSNQYIYDPQSSTIAVPTAPLASSGGNCVALIQSNGSAVSDASPVVQAVTLANGMTATALSPYTGAGGSWFNSSGDGAIIMSPGVYNC
jgi:hypothetical protein